MRGIMPLPATQVIKTGIATGEIKESPYIGKIFKTNVLLPQLDKSIRGDIVGLFCISYYPIGKSKNNVVIRQIDLLKGLAITCLKPGNKIMVREALIHGIHAV